MLDEPAIPATLRPLATTCTGPRTPIHAADVCVIQLLVAQSAEASTEVSVVLVGAKFMPARVTLAVTEAML